MAYDQIALALDALNVQLLKVADEINGKLAELQEALDAQGEVPENVQVLLNSIQATVDSLDSIVPDADEEEEDEDDDEEEGEE